VSTKRRRSCAAARFAQPADLDIERLFNDGIGIAGGSRTHHAAAEFNSLGRGGGADPPVAPPQVVTERASKVTRVDMDVAGLRDAANLGDRTLRERLRHRARRAAPHGGAHRRGVAGNKSQPAGP
jgi:hypothetical protein